MHFSRGLRLCCLLPVLAMAVARPAWAEDARIAALRAADRKSFTDTEIIDGFLKTTIGAEFKTQGRADRIRKFDRPVRVFIDDRGAPNRIAQIADVVADVGSRVQNLDIAVTTERLDANVLVTLVRNGDLAKTIADFYGSVRARQIEHSLVPQCLSGLAKDETFRIIRSEVFLVTDVGDFVFYDCAYEEMLQALGPINDTDTVPWTMFNDRVQKGFFDIYDQLILNILYNPRMQAGMTRDEALAALPQIIPEARTFVAKTNNLPSGDTKEAR